MDGCCARQKVPPLLFKNRGTARCRPMSESYTYHSDVDDCYNQLQKCWDTPTEKRPFLLQIAPGHRSVKYNTDLPPPSHSKLFFQVLSMVLYCYSNFDKRWRRNHKDKIMDRPFMPKYSTVSQVLFQLVIALIVLYFFAIRGWNKDFRGQWFTDFEKKNRLFTLTARFTDFFTDFEKKKNPAVLQSNAALF